MKVKTPPIEDRNNYESNVLIDFRSEMFYSITPSSTKKNILIKKNLKYNNPSNQNIYNK